VLSHQRCISAAWQGRERRGRVELRRRGCVGGRGGREGGGEGSWTCINIASANWKITQPPPPHPHPRHAHLPTGNNQCGPSGVPGDDRVTHEADDPARGKSAGQSGWATAQKADDPEGNEGEGQQLRQRQWQHCSRRQQARRAPSQAQHTHSRVNDGHQKGLQTTAADAAACVR
jgi:hypothetical protein